MEKIIRLVHSKFRFK